jgi:hypothetical protein
MIDSAPPLVQFLTSQPICRAKFPNPSESFGLEALATLEIAFRLAVFHEELLHHGAYGFVLLGGANARPVSEGPCETAERQ